jgi:hypothetical protein
LNKITAIIDENIVIGKKGRKTVRKTMKIFLIVLIVLIAALFSLGFYVNNLGVVLPNVWVDGINLSGMTRDEAVQFLIDSGYEKNAAGVSATIMFPNGRDFTIFGEEVGFSYSAAKAANEAFWFGRDNDSFLGNEIAYVRALFTTTDFRNVGVMPFNREFVRELAMVQTGLFNDGLIDYSYSINSDNITIDLGTGLKPADAEQVYNLAVRTLFQALEHGAHLSVSYTPEEIEVRGIDLDLLYDRISVRPVSSQYDPEMFGATESLSGVTFDMTRARVNLHNALFGSQIVIPLLAVEPEVTQAGLEGMLFRDVLAERTTFIAGTNNRLNNIVISSAAVDGTILNPGDEFSFNQVVGRRTVANGFMPAGAFVGGRLVDVVGGGICQTTSSIYDCVLHADLEVVERVNHGFMVTYIPLGQDATVSWGSLDFRFRNNTDFPIRIESTVSGRSLTVRLIGTKLDDNYIVVRSEQISSTPFRVVERVDESVPPGRTVVYNDGYRGFVVDTFQDLFDVNGELISTTYVGRSVYRVQNRIILVPPAPAPPAPPAPPPDSTPAEVEPNDPTTQPP